MMFGYGYGHGGGWPVWAAGLTWLGMIAVAGLVIWAVYAAVSGASRRRADGPGQDAVDPGQILAERLARGEIDAAEYQRLLEVLATGRTQRPADAGSRT
jgi:putative membrane protein